MIVFRARECSWRFGVTRMEVERATKKSVWINGRRVARESEGTKIFDDFGSAKAWLIERLDLRIEGREQQLSQLKHRRELALAISEGNVVTKTERW